MASSGGGGRAVVVALALSVTAAFGATALYPLLYAKEITAAQRVQSSAPAKGERRAASSVWSEMKKT